MLEIASNNHMAIPCDAEQFMLSEDELKAVLSYYRNKLDDRIENLREASQSQNKANSRLAFSKRLPIKGVYQYKSWGEGYFAVVTKMGKRHKFGPFPTADEAHKRYIAEAEKLHGAFSHDGSIG